MCDVKITFHTCGVVVALFEDLIEMGIDAVNPVQVDAKWSSPTDLVHRYN